MRTDLVALTIEQVLEDLIIDVQLSTSISGAGTQATASSAEPDNYIRAREPLSPSPSIGIRVSSSSVGAAHTQAPTGASASRSGISNAEVARAAGYSSAAAHSQPTLLIPPPAGLADTVNRPADGPKTHASKLLALKKKRLESLSSSMDLSRESSFDTFDAAPSTGKNDSVLMGTTKEPTLPSASSMQTQDTQQLSPPLESTSGTQQ